MARGIQNYPNVTTPDGDYPNGRSKDNPGNNTGTPVNLETLGDYQQFFAKMMRLASLSVNGMPENEYTGFQYIDALNYVAGGYKSYVAMLTQTGTNAPVATVMNPNTIGSIVWTRSSVGAYLGTLSNVFTASKTIIIVNGIVTGVAVAGYVAHLNINPNVIEIFSYDSTGTKADGILTNTVVEVRVYRQ